MNHAREADLGLVPRDGRRSRRVSRVGARHIVELWDGRNGGNAVFGEEEGAFFGVAFLGDVAFFEVLVKFGEAPEEVGVVHCGLEMAEAVMMGSSFVRGRSLLNAGVLD